MRARRAGSPQLLVALIAVLLTVSGGLTADFRWQAAPDGVSAQAPAQSGTGPSGQPAQTTAVVGAREQAVRQLSVNCAAVPCIALTFDDGPAKETTPLLLDILERDGAAATFFVLGTNATRHEPLLRRIYANGHEIGNHGWSHTSFVKLTPTQMHDEIGRTQAAVRKAGLPQPTLFRPPYGESNDTVRAHVPLTFAYWNEDPKDWSAPKMEDVVTNVLKDARPGGVVVLHDTEHKTVEALPYILRELRARGLHPVTMTHLLGIQPGAPGPFYGRH